jgi:hypothetical protein
MNKWLRVAWVYAAGFMAGSVPTALAFRSFTLVALLLLSSAAMFGWAMVAGRSLE